MKPKNVKNVIVKLINSNLFIVPQPIILHSTTGIAFVILFENTWTAN